MKLNISQLIEWYFSNQRNFPWRTQIYLDRQLWAYHTWICEVMSQQTLLAVVLPKFNQFIHELPDVEALANCSDELLRYLWSGLGYYARARNLRKGAQFIVAECGGQLPSSQAEWLKVPGCGPYTSSIIASICFSEIVPAIDGNVIRVVSRLLGLNAQVWEKSGQEKILSFMTSVMKDYFAFYSSNLNKKDLEQERTHLDKFIAKEWLLKNTQPTPGDFNQAFMELGATVCKKNNPTCEICPLQNSCCAYQQNIVHLCPPVKPRKQSQEQNLYAFVLHNKKKNSYLLVERESGFLAKTLGFPLSLVKSDFLEKIESNDQIINLEKTFHHQITHHKITGFVILIETTEENTLFKNKMWVSSEHLKKHLSSSLDRKVIKILSL